MASEPQATGRRGEAQALALLRKHGLKLITENWHCRAGELDLVMLDGDTVVFAEVRYRRHRAWGGAAASVGFRKQQKLIKAAQLFLLSEPRWNRHPCRFDVVALGGDAREPTCDWIRNAFECMP